jgi:AcrR family transcriptional regulator
MPRKHLRRTTLTRDDWLAGAMELLRERGVGGVRILTLAQRMGVSRGSFYWYFKDLADLLDGMVEWWDREMTDSVIRHTETVPRWGR